MALTARVIPAKAGVRNDAFSLPKQRLLKIYNLPVACFRPLQRAIMVFIFRRQNLKRRAFLWLTGLFSLAAFFSVVKLALAGSAPADKKDSVPIDKKLRDDYNKLRATGLRFWSQCLDNNPEIVKSEVMLPGSGHKTSLGDAFILYANLPAYYADQAVSQREALHLMPQGLFKDYVIKLFDACVMTSLPKEGMDVTTQERKAIEGRMLDYSSFLAKMKKLNIDFQLGTNEKSVVYRKGSKETFVGRVDGLTVVIPRGKISEITPAGLQVLGKLGQYHPQTPRQKAGQNPGSRPAPQ